MRGQRHVGDLKGVPAAQPVHSNDRLYRVGSIVSVAGEGEIRDESAAPRVWDSEFDLRQLTINDNEVSQDARDFDHGLRASPTKP